MSLTAKEAAEAMRRNIMKRASVDACGELQLGKESAWFKVYDNDGGILAVNVMQYKSPLR